MTAFQSWMSVIDTLSGNDITKHNVVMELNYIHCLNTLEIYKIRDDMTDEYQKNMMNK
jgi:hypothetical protein